MAITTQKRYNAYVGSVGLPRQTLSTTAKQDRKWREGCLDYFDQQSASQSKEKYEMKRNYDLVNGIFNVKDYAYLSDPLSLGTKAAEEYGTTLDIKHYPIMNRPIQTMLGEYINRPFNWFVVNESDTARNEAIRVKTEMLQQMVDNQISARLQQKLKAQGIPVNSEQGQQMIKQMTPESIQEYMDKDYIDVAEQTAQRMLKIIWRNESLDDEFVEGFKHAIISAREFYHMYTVNGKVKVRNLSPLDVFYHRSPSVKWISDAQYAGFRLYLTPSSIIDMYYDRLSSDDIEELEYLTNPSVGRDNPKKTGIGSISYDTQTYVNSYGTLSDRYNNEMMQEMITNFQLNGDASNYFSTFGLVKVVQAYWKSYRRIGILTYYDQYDVEQKTVVDDNYVPNKAAGESIEWRYCNQVYQGAKLGDHIYLDIAPYTDAILDIENLDYCPLPIEGCTYNDTNSRPLSMVDLMRPWNELYNITAYELRKDMNSSLGKVLFMSLDHIPNIPGFSREKWYYWLKELKIAWVKQPQKAAANTFNQFSAADMSFAQSILAKMETLERIKMECDSIAGFSQPRIGAQTNQSTLGESRQQVVASSNQTEYYFFKHNKLIERVLNHALNLAKKVEREYGVMRNSFNDLEQNYIKSGDTLTNARLGLFVSNSAQDYSSKQKLEAMLNLAVSNGADVVDAGDILLATTTSEVRNIFKSLRRKKAEATQAEREHEERLQQMINEDKQSERDFKREIEYAKMDSNEEVAYIKTYGGVNNSNTQDTDGDGIADILQYEEHQSGLQFKQRDLLLKERKQWADESFKRTQLRQQDRKLELERDKIKSQERIASINRNKYSK